MENWSIIRIKRRIIGFAPSLAAERVPRFAADANEATPYVPLAISGVSMNTIGFKKEAVINNFQPLKLSGFLF